MVISFEEPKGFSLIELVVSLLIITILLGIAVPGFSYLVSWYRAESAVVEFSSGIEKAKYLAVSKGCTVKISLYMDDDIQAPGFCIYIDNDGNNLVSEADEVIYRHFFKGVKINKLETTIDGNSKPLYLHKSGFVKGGTLCIEMPSGKTRKVVLQTPSGKIRITTEG
ncbi:MAG: prepilin-type N-terminal cleavage/methylation domain-containing protein [Desulforegulaceae bacterium]|nr:prepilin-type N-terminal cleavage/methylation domain-containing protein [Desulforegulaceae bacterium]